MSSHRTNLFNPFSTWRKEAKIQGAITITYTPEAGDGTNIMQPTLTTNGEITWTCTGGTLLSKYRPATCR